MDINNPLYKGQGLHVLTALFTVDDGKFKVLLLKRKNQPFKDKWTLVGGACYNNETLEDAMNREMNEKVGLKGIDFKLFNVYSDINRSPVMRMVAIAYIAVIDSKKFKFLKETSKAQDADWFLIDRVPPLGYDHDKILQDAIDFLREKIFDGDILRNLFPEYFTLPELYNAYCSILDRAIDRRNFRKKLLNSNLIEDTGKIQLQPGKKSAKLYRFTKDIKKIII